MVTTSAWPGADVRYGEVVAGCGGRQVVLLRLGVLTVETPLPRVLRAKEMSAVVEEALYQTKNRSNQETLNYPIQLNNKLAALLGVVQSADAAPTDQSRQLQEELASAINVQLNALAVVKKDEVPAFNEMVRESKLPAVELKGVELKK